MNGIYIYIYTDIYYVFFCCASGRRGGGGMNCVDLVKAARQMRMNKWMDVGSVRSLPRHPSMQRLGVNPEGRESKGRSGGWKHHYPS